MSVISTLEVLVERVAVLGVRNANVGSGARTVKTASLLTPPPGVGFTTRTAKIAGWGRNVPGIVAVRRVALT